MPAPTSFTMEQWISLVLLALDDLEHRPALVVQEIERIPTGTRHHTGPYVMFLSLFTCSSQQIVRAVLHTLKRAGADPNGLSAAAAIVFRECRI